MIGALPRQGSRLGASSSKSARTPNPYSRRRRQQCRQQQICRSGYYMQAPAAAASPVDKLLEGFWEVRCSGGCCCRQFDGTPSAVVSCLLLNFKCSSNMLIVSAIPDSARIDVASLGHSSEPAHTVHSSMQLHVQIENSGACPGQLQE
jgi:hypothetical protein